jgi:hypothetical protein
MESISSYFTFPAKWMLQPPIVARAPAQAVAAAEPDAAPGRSKIEDKRRTCRLSKDANPQGRQNRFAFSTEEPAWSLNMYASGAPRMPAHRSIKISLDMS